MTLRQYRDGELVVDTTEKPMRKLWDTERFRNNFAAMSFFKYHPKIPVPNCRLYEQAGILFLDIELKPEYIRLEQLPPDTQLLAMELVQAELKKDVIPALQQHRRSFIGSVDETMPVFPPQRVYQRDSRSWDRVTSDEESFVFCHNDLSPANLWIHSNTYKLVAITGWEFAGYFPPHFELPLWTKLDQDARLDMGDKVLARDLELFGLKPEDLNDCIPLPHPEQPS